MTKVDAVEMRNIEGGKTATCKCGKKFKDIKFLWWVIYSGEKQLAKHKRLCIKCY